jgi:formylglycine-generating enzyme
MRKPILFCNAALASLTMLAVDAQAVTMNWSLVGNPGNLNDPTTGSRYGAVGYSYNIGTYDVTNSQYVEFLNTKDPSGANTLGLFDQAMSDFFYGGIRFNASNANGNKYSVFGGNGNHPVNYVSWYDTLRFANWLNNGQGNGDTETGAYTLGALGAGGVPIHGNTITRNPGANVFLPSENEWYKAAYNIPGTNSYLQYGTGSNSVPTGSSPTALLNHANFSPGNPDSPTDVGAYTGTTSPFGAFDMGGNVFQWNESSNGDFGGSERGLRGGSFNSTSFYLLSSNSIDDFAISTQFERGRDYGFRVASFVPEPSSLVLAALGFIGIAWHLRRR